MTDCARHLGFNLWYRFDLMCVVIAFHVTLSSPLVLVRGIRRCTCSDAAMDTLTFISSIDVNIYWSGFRFMNTLL